MGDDFSLYRYYRGTCRDRGAISPLFDTASSFIDETNGFWVCGFNEADELIHTQAVRLLDLSGVTLGKHLDMHRHKYIVPDTTPDPDLTFFQGPEALKIVTGLVGYCGDFWLPSRGLGGPRSNGATGLLSRLLFEVLEKAWQPDFVFAFVPKQLAAKGAHLRYGYSHCEAGNWIGPDHQITNDEYLIWMNANDIKNVLARDVQSLRLSNQVSAQRASVTAINAKV
ncbi:hypothetical protein [Yoonia sp.]|uniref:hypothetical protein n=1 Tax=Yoonia sp. TaxID=2212373 RepID=UPI0039768D62